MSVAFVTSRAGARGVCQPYRGFPSDFDRLARVRGPIFKTAFVIAFATVRCEQGKHLLDTESDADEKAMTYFSETDLIGSFHALVPLGGH